jgi:hypothetical protein
MADTDEEQLLSDLLGDIEREDARLDASHLEARVLESASIRQKPHNTSKVWVIAAVAAAILIAVMVTFRPHPDATERTAGIVSSPTDVTTAQPSLSRVDPQPGAPRAIRREPVPAGRAIAELPVPESVEPIEFVPLLPFTDQELSGSFQIVRVQMPSASLGALRPPLAHPDEIVEADVLLGEDGRARAIRLNTNGSVYPWRSR